MQPVTPSDLLPEMWDEILARCDGAALAALARVDRAWHARVQPLITAELRRGFTHFPSVTGFPTFEGQYGVMFLSQYENVICWRFAACACCRQKALDEQKRACVYFDRLCGKTPRDPLFILHPEMLRDHVETNKF
jgi:hypothetical protein